MTPVATLPVNHLLDLEESGGGILNEDGSECPPEARLSGTLQVGPFLLHVEAYEVEAKCWGAGCELCAKHDAFADEVEACFTANGDETPESQEINGRRYVIRAFPFAE